MLDPFQEPSVQADVTSCTQEDAQMRPNRPGTLAPCAIVVFGASGDLAMRKLFPALFHLFGGGHLPERFAVVGASRTTFNDAGFRKRVNLALADVPGSDATQREDFLGRVFYHPLTYDQAPDYLALADRLNDIDVAMGVPGNRLFYLAVPPQLYPVIVEELGRGGLSREDSRQCGWSRIVLEKPFGHDLESATTLNALLHQHFDEH